MKKFRHITGVLGVMLTLVTTGAGAQVTASYSDGVLQLGNEYLSRTFSVVDGKLKTTSIVNKRTTGGSTTFTPGTGSEEFAVGLVKSGSTVADPSVLSRTGWKATCDSWCVDNAKGGSVDYILDGQSDTYWHTNYRGTSGTGAQVYPHWFTIDAGKSVTFVSFGYLPRQDFETVNGNIGQYELYVSDTEAGLSTATPVAKGTFSYHGVDEIRVNLTEPVTGRYIRLKALTSHNGTDFAGCAEFNLYSEKAASTINGFFTSDLTVKDVNISDITNGKHVTISFAPYTYNNVVWTVKMNLEMNNGSHYIHKWLDLSVPTASQSAAVIDYIDFEHFNTDGATNTWTHPQMGGGVGGMSGYFISLGQPIYIDGMFFGSEFPMTETQIDNNEGHIRYYLGKSFSLLSDQNRLTDGTFTTWKSVTGATRSATDMDVIRSDFFSYIEDIATPTKVRFQYNSWYDWMMGITRDNIITSFKEMERGFTQNGMPPIDSYVMDDGWNAYGDYQSENTAGFWQFNSKFPNGLLEPSDFAHRVGSNFGLWLGPRGGYNYNASFAQFLEQHGNGKYNSNSGDIVTNHKVYLQKLQEFFLDCQKKYDINYWKLDGFSTQPAQADPAGNYITGGTNGMYYMTEHWERWIELFKVMRAEGESKGLNYWLNLTCYINPSPWYLQWANTVWMQNSNDMGRTNLDGRTRDVDKLLSYRDGRYYDFIKTRQFQFPLSHIFNHDPTYGKTNCVSANAMTKDEFRTYLMMMGMRGTAFWEMLYSYNLLNEDEKWMVNAEVMNWIRDNYNILRNSKQIGGNSEQGQAYGYSAWEGNEGILAVRNPSNNTVSFSFKLDRSIGVTEGLTGLHRATLLNANTTTADDNSSLFDYGQSISLSMAPGEVRIWKFQQTPDAEPAKVLNLTLGSIRMLTVQFDKQISSLTKDNLFIDGAPVERDVVPYSDKCTFKFYTPASMVNGQVYTLHVKGAKDIWGNVSDEEYKFTYYSSSVLARANSVTDFANPDELTATESGFTPVNLSKGEHALSIDYGFYGTGELNISFWLKTKSKSCVIMKEGDDVKVGIDADGKLTFTVCGLTVTSDIAVNDDVNHFISVCRERNGMLKIYIDGNVNASHYDANNVNPAVKEEHIVLGDGSFEGSIGHFELRTIAYKYNEVATMAAKTYPTGISSTKISKGDNVIISPLPVRDTLTVSNLKHGMSVALYTVNGQRLASCHASSSECAFDMSSYAKGTYVVTVLNGSKRKSYKVSKL
jgi:hypothetical protein